MNARTIVMDAAGELSTRAVPVPELGPGALLVRVELTGICGTDVHMRRGGMELPFPVVPGHELAGTVEAVGGDGRTDATGDPLSTGDAVTVVPGYNAVEDWYTDRVPARPLACTDRTVYGLRSVEEYPHLHGGMSQFLVVERDAHCYRLPDDLDVELGALVEPLSVATHALDTAAAPGLPWIREGFGIGQSVAVQGAGPIGLLTMAAASTAGAGQVIALDRLDERLGLAREFGATDLVNVDAHDDDDALVAAVNEATSSGDGPDVVVEAVGHPSAFEQSIELVRKAGTVVEVGHYAAAGEASIDPSTLVHRELSVRGSLAYLPNQFETAISMLHRTGDRFPYRDLFNYRVGLDDATAAYDAQAEGRAYRATIHPWE